MQIYTILLTQDRCWGCVRGAEGAACNPLPILGCKAAPGSGCSSVYISAAFGLLSFTPGLGPALLELRTGKAQGWPCHLPSHSSCARRS